MSDDKNTQNTPYDPASNAAGTNQTSNRDNASKSASDMAHETKEAAREHAHSLKEEVRSSAEQLREEGKDRVQAEAEHYKESAAGETEATADAFRDAADHFDSDDIRRQAASQLADGIGAVADRIRETDLSELPRDLKRFARENPALFYTGAAALGFAVTRLLTASERRSSDDDYDTRAYGRDDFDDDYRGRRGAPVPSPHVASRPPQPRAATTTGPTANTGSTTHSVGERK